MVYFRLFGRFQSLGLSKDMERHLERPVALLMCKRTARPIVRNCKILDPVTNDNPRIIAARV